MARENCPNPRDDCKYYPDCFADRHHLYPQRLGKTVLTRTFINLPENVVRVCRRFHEESAPEFYLPSKGEMKQAIARAAITGDYYLSQDKLKKIFNADTVDDLKGLIDE